MTYDHRTTDLHRANLDREIDSIRNERLLDRHAPGIGLIGRARRGTGRVLIAAGVALAGREAARLRTHRI